MKLKELIELLRISVPIEIRVDNYTYGNCQSNDLLPQYLCDREIEDWFVFSGKHCICINLKRGTRDINDQKRIYR